jgi:hypothetical protein
MERTQANEGHAFAAFQFALDGLLARPSELTIDTAEGNRGRST